MKYVHAKKVKVANTGSDLDGLYGYLVGFFKVDTVTMFLVQIGEQRLEDEIISAVAVPSTCVVED